MTLCICNKLLPDKAKHELSRFADLIEFFTNGITYEAISGHPDIFFCKVKNSLIVAPNVPDEYKNILTGKKAEFGTGADPVKHDYPGSAGYNAVITGRFLIHRTDITDPALANACLNLEKIHMQQGYTRCSLLPLKGNSFITSDYGIYKTLSGRNLNVLYVKPDGIILPGYSHGFFGGTCGVYEDTVLFAGNLGRFADGDAVREFLRLLKYDVVELYDGPLFDCGSLMMIE